MQEAYAFVFSNGEVAIDTVSSTERAAQVNALVVFAKIEALNYWTDEQIAKIFTQKFEGKGSVRPITVSTT